MAELSDLYFEKTQLKFSIELKYYNNDALRANVILEFGKMAQPINTTFIMLHSDIEDIIGSLHQIPEHHLQWIYTVEPSLTMCIVPQKVDENTNLFLFLCILDAGLANSSYSTETGPALAIRVTENHLISFANELNQQLSYLIANPSS